MHLSFLLSHGPAPHTIGQWRLPRSFRGFSYSSPQFWQHVGRTLERGCFDMLFLADAYSLHDKYRGTSETAIEYAVQYPRHDPLPLVPIVAGATSNLGVGVTASTTFLPPYWVARHFATLDHLTAGRVGWNVVTSYAQSEAQNFGLDDIPDHDERYLRADEYLRLCLELWSSWDADALVQDRVSGVFADPTKVHPVDFNGEYFSCRGPLCVAPSPASQPVIIQAGTSPAGLEFAARYAEVCFAIRQDEAGMRAHRERFDAALAAEGRKPEDARILWGLQPIVAETEAEARRKREAIVGQVSVEAGLAMMSGHFNFDLSVLPSDEPLSDFDSEGIRGQVEMVIEDFDESMTLAEVAREFGGGIGPAVVGTPVQIADRLEELYHASSGDGFMLISHELPGCIDDFVDYVVPELQARGLVRNSYRTSTLKGHFFEDGS